MNHDGLKSDSNSVDVLISLADLYIENGLKNEAKKLLQSAIKENSEIKETYIKLSSLYLEENERNKAIKLLEKGLNFVSDDKEILEMLESIRGEKGKKEEVEKKEKAIEEEVMEKETLKDTEEKPVEMEEVEESQFSLEQLLEKEIKKLLKQGQILGVIIVDEDGSPVMADIDLPLNEDSTGVIVSSIYRKVSQTIDEFNMGTMKRVFFEFPGGNIFIYGISYLRFIVLFRGEVINTEVEKIIENGFARIIDILEVE